MITLIEFSSNDTFSELFLFPPKKTSERQTATCIKETRLEKDVNCHLTKVIKSNLITLSKQL